MQYNKIVCVYNIGSTPSQHRSPTYWPSLERRCADVVSQRRRCRSIMPTLVRRKHMLYSWEVGRFYSSYAKVLCGIPQGSIIGPIFFTIFLLYLPNWVSSCCKIFANDTKLYDVASIIMYRSKLTSMLCKGGLINGIYILIQTSVR